MAAGTPSTFQSGLADILGRLGSLMALPDADVAFVTQMQTVIAGKLRQSSSPPPGGGAPGGGPLAGAGPGGPPPGLQMPGAPGPGGRPTMQPPMMGGLSSGLSPSAIGGGNNPDEMRRIIQQITG
jgi:hypothetical protein